MKMMHSAAAAEGRGESPVRCRTLDPEEQQLARKLLDLALVLGVEVWVWSMCGVRGGGEGMCGVRSGGGAWEGSGVGMGGMGGVVGCSSCALPKCLLARLGSGSSRSEWCWSVGLLTCPVHESSLELQYGA